MAEIFSMKLIVFVFLGRRYVALFGEQLCLTDTRAARQPELARFPFWTWFIENPRPTPASPAQPNG